MKEPPSREEKDECYYPPCDKKGTRWLKQIHLCYEHWKEFKKIIP